MRRLGFCPEHDAAYPKAPIIDALTYLTRLHGFSRSEARTRAQAALDRVGLTQVAGRAATTFSKGQRQRAKLAQALAHDPDVVVLDEPLNGLDPTGRREVGDLIRELGAEGRCVLVSSHILHEVQDVSSRVLLLNTGRVLAEGAVADIRDELPEHPLTVRVDTDTPSALAARIVTLDAVQRIERVDGSLLVVTRRPDEFFDRLAAVADEDDVSIQAIVPVDEDLEAVFRYLTQ
jgi:ABC-2 type transport system ATP-binding protein